MTTHMDTTAGGGWNAVPSRDKWTVGAITGARCPRCRKLYSPHRERIEHPCGAHVCPDCATVLGITGGAA